MAKTLNTTGSENMANPHFGNEVASMFLCGDDAEAERVIQELVEDRPGL